MRTQSRIPALAREYSRALLLVAGLVLGSSSQEAAAQRPVPGTPGRIPVVGMLRMTAPTGGEDTAAASMLRALGAYGYIEGQNIGIEQRFAAGRAERMPQQARELVRLGVDVIVAPTEAALRAAMQATRTIPIVVIAYDHDPVAAGLVGSLNRPGANVTGIVSRQTELAGKRLELLKEAIPGLTRVALIAQRTPGRTAVDPRQADLRNAAAQLGLQLVPVHVDGERALATAFERARAGAPAGLLAYSTLFHAKRARVGKLAIGAQLPLVAPERDFVLAGALMSYAPDRDQVVDRVAYFIDRLLRGAKVHELPIERAEKFKLSVNLATAAALGVQLPDTILLRADEVIR